MELETYYSSMVNHKKGLSQIFFSAVCLSLEIIVLSSLSIYFAWGIIGV